MSSSNGESSKGPRRTTVQHQQLPPRPKLLLHYPSAEVPIRPSSSTTPEEGLPWALSGLPEPQDSQDWISVITAPAYAPFQSWITVMQNLIRHPERNSSNILRADILDESTTEEGERRGAGWRKQWSIKRALLPRRPNLDWRMEQNCSLYYRCADNRGVKEGEKHEEDEEAEAEEAIVIYTPLIGQVSHAKLNIEGEPPGEIGQVPPSEAYIPFYHPKVRALAFHFRPSLSPDSSSSDTMYGTLGISLIPFAPSAPAIPTTEAYGPNHRLSRVALSLLTTLHMHTWGDLHSYRKRVHHDTVVPRSLYQDQYLSLKTRYASELIASWAEATDPTKHVFEEMGIAAFLIALWSTHYKGRERNEVRFVDVGCGNGLLTYILAREGFRGVGLDLRQRKSWTHYRAGGATLREWTFDPARLVEEEDDVWKGAWLLGNHADELTPWIPGLATHHRCAGFINLPCCYYALDGTRNFPLLLKGGEVSRNEQYLAYVGELHTKFGWQLELEPLRIPSTKNWCFVARQKSAADPAELEQKVQQAIQEAFNSNWAARTTTAQDPR